MRGPEWRAFADPEPLQTDDFKVRHLPVPEGFENTLDTPIAVDRLREVIALGGLVALAEPDRLASTLRDALNRAGLCSTDPMCADHLADESQDTLHHAACHACMFVPETSCEHGNRYLDRATVVPTLSTSSLAYFSR